MKKGSGKRKGSAFERVVAKTLGEGIFNDSTAFMRTPGSGAMNTVMLSMGLKYELDINLSGDIMQVKYLDKYQFPYSIECKAWKEFKLIDLLTNSVKSQAYKAWEQCLRDSASSQRRPLLIFKENFKPPMVVVDAVDPIHLQVKNYSDWYIETSTVRVITLDTFIARAPKKNFTPTYYKKKED